MKLTIATAALTALFASTSASAAPDASASFQTGLTDALHLSAQIKASAATTFRGNGDVQGSASMFPCPIGPYGPQNGSTSGSADVSGDVAVASDDGKAHGTIHVSGIVWLDGFCSNGWTDMVSGIGTISGSGPVYGANGKLLGTLKVSGSASVSGMGSGNVSGTVSLTGSL